MRQPEWTEAAGRPQCCKVHASRVAPKRGWGSLLGGQLWGVCYTVLRGPGGTEPSWLTVGRCLWQMDSKTAPNGPAP